MQKGNELGWNPLVGEKMELMVCIDEIYSKTHVYD